MKCSECKFCREYEKVKPNNYSSTREYIPAWECRRYPPQVYSLEEGDVNERFPDVGEDDWCGEFESKNSVEMKIL